MPRKISKEELLLICNKRHKYKYDYSLVEYKYTKDKVKIICPIHGIFEQSLNSHKTSGCPECASIKLTNESFIQKSKNIHGDKYDYSLVDYKNAKTKVKILCKDHNIIFEQTPDNHLYGNCSCPYCSNKKWTNEMFINMSKEIHGDKYDYSLVDYKNNTTKVKIICKKHNIIFEQRPLNHIHKKQGCPICNDSKGEKEISILLDKKNIIHIRQKKFDDCKNKQYLPFDFYLPEHNMCIEYDGRQHFEPVYDFGGLDQFEKTKINDNIKNEYCKNNNIKLLRISYKENIVNILNNIL